MIIRAMVVAAACAALVAAGGCNLFGPSDPPLSTSLQGLITESAPQHGKYLTHVRITSISGLSQFASPSSLYHYPEVPWSKGGLFGSGMRPPVTAIGIARRQSYELLGTRVVRAEDVAKAADLLTDVQAKAAVATKAALDSARLRVAIAAQEQRAAAEANASAKEKDARRKQFLGVASDRRVADDRVRQIGEALGFGRESALAAPEIQDRKTGGINAVSAEPGGLGADTALTKELREVEKKVEESGEALRKADADLRAHLNKNPGIVIITWETQKTEKSSLGIGSRAGLNSERSEKLTGYAVLGGFRVRSVNFGGDFKAMYLRMAPEDRLMFRESSVLTYALQTQQIRYVAKADVAAQIDAFIEVYARDFRSPEKILSDIDRIRLSYYLQTLASLGNTGSVDGLNWEVRALNFADPSADFARLQQDCGLPAEDPTTQDGWTTVDGVITGIGGLGPVWEQTLTSQPDVQIAAVPDVSVWGVDDAAIERANKDIHHVNAVLMTDASYKQAASFTRALGAMSCAVERAAEFARGRSPVEASPEQRDRIEKLASRAVTSLGAVFTGIHGVCFGHQGHHDGEAAGVCGWDTAGMLANEPSVIEPMIVARAHFDALTDALSDVPRPSRRAKAKKDDRATASR